MRKPRAEGLLVALRVRSCIKAQETVDQPLEAPYALAHHTGQLGKGGVTEGASLLGYQANLFEVWRGALSERRTAFAQTAAMVET